jgi:peptidoglycan/LPS O-acetylase OafA/YrhL
MSIQINKLSFIESLRGLLAIWVLIYHFINTYQNRYISLIPPGAIAVDFFMVISGFLMTLNLLKKDDRGEKLGFNSNYFNHLLRRFFRIAPLFYVCYAIPFFFGYNTDINDFLLHLTFLFGLFPEHVSRNAIPDWSLSLEMQFYFIIPFILLFIKRYGYLKIVFFCFLINYFILKIVTIYSFNTPGIIHFPQPSFLLLKISYFIMGLLIGLYFLKRITSLSFFILIFISLFTVGNLSMFFLIGLSVIILFVYCNTYLSEDFFLTRRFENIFIEKLNTLFTNNVLLFLGKISYGIYLTHKLVFLIFNKFSLSQVGYDEKNKIHILLLFFLIFSLTLIVSSIGYYLIELPFIKLSDRLSFPLNIFLKKEAKKGM